MSSAGGWGDMGLYQRVRVSGRRSWHCRLGTVARLTEAVAFARESDEMRSVCETVQQGRGHHGIAEDVGPTGELQVRREQERAAKVGQSLLGTAFAGCVMTDRYKGYDWIRRERRQLCWAHLDRDARALIDLGKTAAGYGKGIHRAAMAVFHAWQDFQQAGEGPAARVAPQRPLAGARAGDPAPPLAAGQAEPDAQGV